MKALIVQGGGKIKTNSNLGTHSMKRMSLTWASKAGMLAQLRRTLGYHVAVDEQSMNVYARDAQAGALRALVGIIDSIRNGTFEPDNTRSGRFTAKKDAGEATEVRHTPAEVMLRRDPEPGVCETCGVRFAGMQRAVECQGCIAYGCTACLKLHSGMCRYCLAADDNDLVDLTGPALEEDLTSNAGEVSNESNDEDSMSSKSSEAGEVDDVPGTELQIDVFAAELSKAPARILKPASNASQRVFQHLASSTLHYLRAGSELARSRKLACGREVHSGYKQLSEDEIVFVWPWCLQFCGKPIQS